MTFFKKIIFFSLIAVFSSACNSPSGILPEPDGERMRVAATIFPLFDIVRQVGGERIETQLILAPGSSPHTFETTPGLVRSLSGARAVFMIGAGLDDWAANVAQAAGGAELVDLHAEVGIRPYVDFGHGHDDEHEDASEDEEGESGHGHGDYDPHYWLDPDLAADMAGAVARHLSDLDPAGAGEYGRNAAAFEAELAERARGWQEMLAELDDRELLVFHDAWNYFAAYFGLEIAAAFEPFPGRAPSPRYLADLQAVVSKHGIKALFVEPQLSREALENFAADLGLEVRVIDPLGGVPGRESYIELMEYNVAEIFVALN